MAWIKRTPSKRDSKPMKLWVPDNSEQNNEIQIAKRISREINSNFVTVSAPGKAEADIIQEAIIKENRRRRIRQEMPMTYVILIG